MAGDQLLLGQSHTMQKWSVLKVPEDDSHYSCKLMYFRISLYGTGFIGSDYNNSSILEKIVLKRDIYKEKIVWVIF